MNGSMTELIRIGYEARNGLALGLGTQEIVMILVVVLLLFGGKKIPELMRGVGKGVGELQKGLEEGKRTLHETINQPEPVVTPVVTPVTPVESIAQNSTTEPKV